MADIPLFTGPTEVGRLNALINEINGVFRSLVLPTPSSDNVGLFASIPGVSISDTLTEIRTSGRSAIGDGGDDNFSRVLDGSTAAYDAVDSAGKRFRPYKSELSFRSLGGVGDGTILGAGTDNLLPLQLLMAAIASGDYTRIVIEPGIYCVNGAVAANNAAIRNVEIVAWGAQFIQTNPTKSANTHYFRITNPTQTGGQLTVRGLQGAMGRASGRVGNTDMFLFEGFAAYDLIMDCWSSDNMGVTIGRGDPTTWVPDEVIFRGSVGGRNFVAPHEYGSIGDTGLWVPNGARWVDIDYKARSCGDDAAYIGPVPVAAGVALSKQSFRVKADTWGSTTGIHVDMPNGVISGRVALTGSAGVSISPGIDGAIANTFDNVKLDVEVIDAGQMEAGDIGTSIISKANPFGIWFYGAGDNIELGRSSVRRSRGAAICFQPTGVISGVHGNVVIRHPCENLNGTIANDVGAIKRSATSVGNVQDVRLGVDIASCGAPIVGWLINSPTDDSRISFDVKAQDVRVDRTVYANGTLFDFEVANLVAGRLKNTLIELDDTRCDAWDGATAIPVIPLRTVLGIDSQEIEIRHTPHVQRINSVAANTTFVIPAGHAIEAIFYNEQGGSAVTGGMRLGTTNGGADVIVAQAVSSGANAAVFDAAMLKRIFSRTADTTLYLQAVTSWATASVNLKVRTRRVIDS